MRIGDLVQSKWTSVRFIGIVLRVYSGDESSECFIFWVDGSKSWAYFEDLEVICEYR
jgi:hypothetical protein